MGPAYLVLELTPETGSLIPRSLQLLVCRPLVSELALQGQHLVTKLSDAQPEVLLGSLSFRVLELWNHRFDCNS